MLTEVEKLLTLQERDQRIRSLRLELQAIPEERRFKEKQIADAAARLEAAKTEMRATEIERKKLEVDAQARRDQIARYRQQQLQTRKNEEFAALRHEIEAAEKAIGLLEDRELELMEKAEALRPAIAEAERAHAEERARLEAQLVELGKKSANIEATVAELTATREPLTAGLDEEVLDQYTRLFKSKNGVAMAELDHEVCAGCHMKVTTQTALAVKAEKSLTHCPNCGRMLYLPA